MGDGNKLITALKPVDPNKNTIGGYKRSYKLNIRENTSKMTNMNDELSNPETALLS